ncbi:hypothetical protein JYU04_02945 [Dehalococcoides mccartyi]|nr:hypothetical protein [Dehalococcoides mccartyi]
MILIRRNLFSDLPEKIRLAISVLMLTVVLAGAPIYLDTIDSLGLRSLVATLSPSNRNIQVSTSNFPLTRTSIAAATERIDISLRELDDLPIEVVQESHTRPHFWALDADSIIPGRSSDSAVLQRFVGFPEHVDFVEGRKPSDATHRESGVIVGEVAIPLKRAEILGVNLGDDIWLASTPSDLPYLKLEVVGRFVPDDINEEFWFGLAFEALEPPPPSLVARAPLPLFLSGSSLSDLVTGGPASIGTVRWLVRLDADKVDVQGAAATEIQIAALKRSLRSELPESDVVSAIENRFKALRVEISFARIPVLMMGGVLLATAIVFSISIAGSLVGRRRVDMGRLRARGYGRRRIAITQLIEFAPVVVIPALIAPFFALGVITQVGYLPEYEAISLGRGMPAQILWQSFALSLFGAFLVLVVIQIVSWIGDGRSINSGRLSSKQAEIRPFYQRKYLDLAFLLFGGLVLWDLASENSVVGSQSGQMADVSPLLVFAPAIFLGVAILVSLRVLPAIAQIISFVITKRGPAWAHFLWATLARLPVTYSWPIATIGMAVGSVILSGTVAGSLEQSAIDQSGYEVGADLRAFPVDFNSGTGTEVLTRVRNVEGVNGVSLGFRTTGGLRDGGTGAPFEFLAVQPTEFSEIGIFRDDYADETVEQLLLALEPESEQVSGFEPLRLLNDPAQVGVRIRASTPQEFIRASLRFIDATGHPWSADLGAMDSTDWDLRLADVPKSAVRPLDVVGIVFFQQTNNELGTPLTIYVDELVSFKFKVDGNPFGQEGAILESFESTSDWLPLASAKGIDTVVSGFEQALQIDLGVGTNRGVRGVIRTPFEDVPMLFSSEALIESGLSIGDLTVVHVFEQSVPVKVVGELQYFPTLNPDQGGFVVAAADQLWSYVSMSSFNSAGFLAEMFIGLDDSTDQTVILSVSEEIGGIHRLSNRSELLDTSLVSPLAIAGWRGAAILTSVVAIFVAAFSFITFGAVRPAGDRFSLSVLTGMGMSNRALVVASIAEQLIVLLAGIAAGIGIGLFMSRLAVGAITQTVSGNNALPKIVYSTDWAYLVGLVALLLVLVGWTTISYAITLRRTDLAVAVKSQ